jgi:hypothetical protein
MNSWFGGLPPDVMRNYSHNVPYASSKEVLEVSHRCDVANLAPVRPAYWSGLFIADSWLGRRETR